MKKDDLRNSALSGFFWRFFERCGAQGVTFIVSIVLARMLDPEVYGTVALVMVVSSILQTFVDSGLGTALVQKKDADNTDFSTVFYFNLVLCFLIYVIIFLCAKPIAVFYGRPEIVPMIRVLSITIVISGIKNIQQSFVSRNMLFKRFFLSTLVGTIVAAIVGITMAYKGYGAWALIVQNIVNKFIDTLILWVTVKWRPQKSFSISRLSGLWSYGWKLLLTALIDRCYSQLRSLLIGKIYTSSDLAFYNKGDQYPGLIVDNIDASIDSVLLPSMSTVQDSIESVKQITKRAIQVGSYVLMPLLMGLACCATPIVKLMLTEKWLPCVPYLRVFCFSYALRPLNTASLNVIKALGRSDLILKLNVLKKCIGLTLIFLTINISPFALAIGVAIYEVFVLVLNAQANRHLLNYTFFEQMSDMLPSMGISIIMGACVYCITFLPLNDVLTLVIQLLVGIVIFLSLSILFRLEGYKYIIHRLKTIISNKV